MAKANDKSSTVDWIWLHDAEICEFAGFGTVWRKQADGMVGGREVAVDLHDGTAGHGGGGDSWA